MKNFTFRQALPVWAEGREREMNCELAFRATVAGTKPMTIHLAASSIYRIWVNGRFLAAGPARAAHGYYRVDTWDLTPLLTRPENAVVVEVVGFNINSYDTLDQPAFLTAEIVEPSTGAVAAATGVAGFAACDLHQRVQRVQRYSFQRAFAEAYRLSDANRCFYLGAPWAAEETAAVQPEKRYLTREVPAPAFEVLPAEAVVERGSVAFDQPCSEFQRDRALTNIGPTLRGFPMEELELHLSDVAQTMGWTPLERAEAAPAEMPLAHAYATFRFPYNATGFVKLHVRCQQPCTVYLMFDEILSDGDVDILRLMTCNCFQYDLDAGSHTIMTLASYTLKYLKVVVRGSCTISDVAMVEYQHPRPAVNIAISGNEPLRRIRDAAIRTYQQNTLDVFMDCPSRERAGWLCDSFFTARVEHILTGSSLVEKAFLENFLLAESFGPLPAGMLPMCYPADHDDGNFVPNWAMWFVLELEEYLERSGDRTLVDQAKPRVMALLECFRKMENPDGLLEHLPGWVFVEWSAANGWVQDVNFPSNMLYARMLEVAARLYDLAELEEKSRRLKKLIRQRSLRGQFFTDHEIIEDGQYKNPGHQSEVCQYYAFFTGVADFQTDRALWDTLVRQFGPERPADCYPEVAPANAFIGDYLRLELLYRAGQTSQLMADIETYFSPMEARTGTLWEHDRPTASCCHGFASHVLYWMAKIYGVENS